jgi:DNA-directed RNA polymerase
MHNEALFHDIINPFILMLNMILMYQWNFKQNWTVKIHKVQHELQRLIQESILCFCDILLYSMIDSDYDDTHTDLVFPIKSFINGIFCLIFF